MRLLPSESAPVLPSESATAGKDANVSAPRSSITKAQALARSTAGAIAYHDDGRVSVLFPPPGAVHAAPAPVLAREGAEASEAPAPMPAATAAPAPSAAAAPAAAPALDRDELYQDFMRRLRRDVLEQREQLGELF
ncbi:MAG: hypothetical protein QOK16_1540 [Solirubrobacteraceae bacterium]|jgi:hypothetical protein|nr:hypothetical protein [Solirubrobacteraceae bacterium]